VSSSPNGVRSRRALQGVEEVLDFVLVDDFEPLGRFRLEVEHYFDLNGHHVLDALGQLQATGFSPIAGAPGRRPIEGRCSPWNGLVPRGLFGPNGPAFTLNQLFWTTSSL